ncbi:MAG: extracellular solute-binding protein [Oscillospiraceae bacterium]|nr:extracellular solute-binding protein [Oscillospiraceae bacterium]
MKRLCVAAVCCALLIGIAAPATALDSASASAYSAVGYTCYLAEHADAGREVPDIPLTSADCIDAAAAETNGKPAVRCESGQSVTWRFTAAQAGLYGLTVSYLPVDGTGGSMEINLSLDGTVPFNEARGLLLKREYQYASERVFNQLGNEITPEKTELRRWSQRTLYSSSGAIGEALLFYLTEGDHELTLEATREPVAYGELLFHALEQAPAYEEVLRGYREAGYAETGLTPVDIEAETPFSVSDVNLYPGTDRSSAYTSPPSDQKIVLNVIGGDSWKSAGQFIRYTVKVERSGLYTLGFRYKQDAAQGRSVYRKLLIDGQLPFREAAAIDFPYDNGWQTRRAGNGQEDYDYLFYFEAGRTYELTLEVVCGEYTDVLAELNDALSELSAIYRSILMITGPDPDLYRDYGFKQLIPDVIEQVTQVKAHLAAIKESIKTLSRKGGFQATAIDNLLVQLEKMAGRPEKFIASSLTEFQSNISALGTWIMNTIEQPLMLDALYIHPADAALPRGDTGFFATVWYELKRFFASFYNDYSLAGTGDATGAEEIKVWMYSGRDQAQILRNMIDTRFVSKKNIAVNLKLVTAGTLMPAVLAGKGPDVSLGAGSTEPINLAIRNAVADLTQFSGCTEVLERFHSSAVVPFTFRGAVYALPETQAFLMMFCRMDILEELGVGVPRTWDELYDSMLELQINNLTIGLPSSSYSGFLMFLLQNGGELYSEDASASLLGTDTALSSFKQLTDHYVLYDYPVQYDFANRFRSGEMPLAIQEYTAYNQLTLFAPEIKGLWQMEPIPGTLVNGELNYSSPGTVTGAMIMKQTQSPQACWTFLDWWTSEDAQSEFGLRMESVLGDSGKYATANYAALNALPWSYTDRENLNTQWEQAVGIPEVPGGYYSQRYVEFAFNRVINASAPAVDTLENYVTTVTAELKRKLAEFGY